MLLGPEVQTAVCMSSVKKERRFTPGLYPDLMEDRLGLDDRVLCFHG